MKQKRNQTNRLIKFGNCARKVGIPPNKLLLDISLI